MQQAARFSIPTWIAVHTLASLISSLCNRLAFRRHVIVHSLMLALLEIPLLQLLTGAGEGSYMELMSMLNVASKVRKGWRRRRSPGARPQEHLPPPSPLHLLNPS
jgi:hypothetical protein